MNPDYPLVNLAGSRRVGVLNHSSAETVSCCLRDDAKNWGFPCTHYQISASFQNHSTSQSVLNHLSSYANS